jgi:hypothetical protein
VPDPSPTSPPAGRRRAAGEALAALLLHGALVAWLTWPFVQELGVAFPLTELIAVFDTRLVGWALAHQSHALLSDPGSFFHGNAFHPAPHALLHGEAGFGALPLFLPVYALSGSPTLALGLTFLGGVILTAWTLHLVAREWTGSFLAGVVAGGTFLTSRWTLWSWVPAAPNYAVLFYLPLIVRASAAPMTRVSQMLALAALVALQGAVSHYLAAAALGPLLLMGLWRLSWPRERRGGALLLGACGLGVVPLAFLYLPSLLLLRSDPGLVDRTAWKITKVTRTDLPWDLVAPSLPAAIAVPIAILIAAGIVVRLLAARWPGAAGVRRVWQVAGFWAFCGLLMAPTPAVRWFGEPVRLPYFEINRWLPLWEVIRVPSRLAVASLIGLSLLAALAFAECTGRLGAAARLGATSRRILTAACLSTVAWLTYAGYAHGAWWPRHPNLRPLPAAYPTYEPGGPTTPFLDVLRGGRGPLLELPVDVDHQPTRYRQAARAMYDSLAHWRPLLNGYSGYFPAGHAERMALAAALPDRQALAALRAETGLELVLVHRAELVPGPAMTAWYAIIERGGRDDLELLAAGGHTFLFRVLGGAEGSGRPGADGAATGPGRPYLARDPDRRRTQGRAPIIHTDVAS